MTANTVESIRSLFKRLAKAGYKKPYVQKHGFPDWWEDDHANDASEFYEAKLTLARRLGLDLGSVLNPDQPIRLRDIGTCRFKSPKDKQPSCDRKPAHVLAHTLAEIASVAVDAPYRPLPSSGLRIREDILALGHPWIGFEELLSYLWAHGIPVLFLADPPLPKLMDGMVTMVRGRPVIILAKNEKSCAWQLFILAHEVGHIAKGHVRDNETLTDKEIKKQDEDPEEQEANHCAIEIITADGETRFRSKSGRWISAESLAHDAFQLGHEIHVDPGHIVLNYGNANEQLPTAKSALKIIEASSSRAQDVIFRYLVENINPDRLPEENYTFLMQMCGNAEMEATEL